MFLCPINWNVIDLQICSWINKYKTLQTNKITSLKKKWLMSTQLTHKVCRWKQCSFLQLSSQWTLHKCASPSDASPDGKWLADCLKGNSDLDFDSFRMPDDMAMSECWLFMAHNSPVRAAKIWLCSLRTHHWNSRWSCTVWCRLAKPAQVWR